MTVTFERWVQTALDHPPKEPEWFWEDDFESLWDSLDLSDVVMVRFLTRLLLETEHLKPYSLEQVAQAIWFLFGGSSPSKSSQALLEPAVRLNERVACIYAMAKFFQTFVAPAATGRANTDSDPFHQACYMWWDILPLRPFRGDPLEGELELHNACLKAMTDILELPSDVCRISALHGLNHWHEHYAEHVEATIDTFLLNTQKITPSIREYASKARSGLCL